MNATMTLQTIEHNGFHGLTTVRFRPIGEGRDPMTGKPAWLVSLRTARRLNAAVCGISDCLCGECLVTVVDPYSDTPVSYVPQVTEMRGSYPQSR